MSEKCPKCNAETRYNHDDLVDVCECTKCDWYIVLGERK